MGSRGPLPRPGSSESKRRRNTLYRKPGASPAKASAIAPPDFVKGDAVALRFWNEHALPLAQAGRLKPEQSHTFGLVCEMASECRRLTAAVSAEGHTIEGTKGPRANPKVRLLRDARRDLLAAARGFGLDSLSDARLPVEPVDDDDSADAKLLREMIYGAGID